MKTPEERGPFATWVVEARDALGLSSEQVAAQTGYSDAAIRKLEAGNVTRPQRQKVTELLQRTAAEKGMRLPPVPAEQQPASPDADLASAIRELVEEVRLTRLAQERSAEVLAELIGAVAVGRLPRQGSEAEADAPSPSGAR